MKVLCGHCFNKEEYITKKVIVTDVFNKEEVTYFKTIAYCSKCGNEVYVEEIEEKNLEAYQDAYCQKMELSNYHPFDKFRFYITLGYVHYQSY